jgi:hypothetical protein
MLIANRIRRYFSTSGDQRCARPEPASSGSGSRSFDAGLNGVLAVLRESSSGRAASEGRPRSALPKKPASANPTAAAQQVPNAGFSDKDLAVAIRKIIVESGVLTKRHLGTLISSPSEEAVRRTLGADLTAAERAFRTYWRLLGAWLSERGGDIEALSGRNFAGRSGAQPDISMRAIYNDAFRDVRVHLEKDGFNVVKAVANHLRLAKVFS